MKKGGLKLDKAKLKKFMIHNVEKFVFGLSMLVVAGLIYAGLTRESYDKVPADVERQVKSARENIARLQIYKEQEWGVSAPTFVATARRASDQVPKESFEALVLSENKSMQTGEKRDKPEMLAVTDLHVTSGVGPFAFINLNVQRPQPGVPGQLGAQGNQPLTQRQPPKKKGKQTLADIFKQQPAAGAGTGAGLAGGEAGFNGGFLPGGVDMPGEGGVDGAMVPGMDAGMAGMGVEGGGAGGVQAPPDSEVKGVQWVCLTALVPHRKLVGNYIDVFHNAGFKNPQKDYPNYLMYLVERADVTDNDASDPDKLKWEPLQVRTELERTRRWAAVGQEIVNPAMTHPILTFPLGPLLGRNWSKDVAHPKIPMMEAAAGMGAGMMADGGQMGTEGPALSPELINFEEAKPGSDLEFLRKGMPAKGINRAGLGAGAGVDGMMMPGGVPGMGVDGEGGGYGGLPGSYGVDAGMGADIPGMMGEGGMGFDGTMSPEQMGPEHLLLRFFDFNVKKGRLYRYRVQLVMANPNEGIRPQYLKNSELAKASYELGPWSEPSPVAEVTSYGYMLAGPVTPARGLSEAEARAVVVQFDQELGVKATDECRSPKPKEKKVMGPLNRGQFVHYTAEIDVVHPLTNQAAQTEMEFSLDMTLLDLKGGDPLMPDDKTNRDKIPGELLFLSPNGRLIVKSELDDEREFNHEVRLLDHLKAQRDNPMGSPLDGGFPDGLMPGEGGFPMGRMP